jgi:hypothetical protein
MPVLMKYTGYLVHRTSTTGEQIYNYCVDTLLYEPNKNTAQQSITNKNNATMTQSNTVYNLDGQLHNCHGQGVMAAIFFGC